jgi:hypothetical protein
MRLLDELRLRWEEARFAPAYDEYGRGYVPSWQVVTGALVFSALLAWVVITLTDRVDTAYSRAASITPVPAATAPAVFGPTPDPCLQALRLADQATSPITSHTDYLQATEAYRAARRECVIPVQ